MFVGLFVGLFFKVLLRFYVLPSLKTIGLDTAESLSKKIRLISGVFISVDNPDYSFIKHLWNIYKMKLVGKVQGGTRVKNET